MTPRSGRRRLRFQTRVLLAVLLAASPAWLTASLLILAWDANAALRWTLFVCISLFVAFAAFAVQRQVVHPLRSLANLLEALREDDYSLRGRNVDPEDAVGEVMVEVNSLSSTLYDQRLEALEAGVLLNKVIAEVDIAVFAFDAARRLRLVNSAGEALLGAVSADVQGRGAAELGLAAMLDSPSGRIVSHLFPGGAGRWEIRRRSFREGGRPHELLVISDVSRALRDEERQAWRRIVRVIGHELNGSLAPIKSMAGTLQKLIDREPPPPDWRDDAKSGLSIIHDRAASLGRFMGAYARLARLPPPVRRETEFEPIVRRAASLHGDCVRVEQGPQVRLEVDADQIEQVLINLIKNAVEAVGDVWSAAQGSQTMAGPETAAGQQTAAGQLAIAGQQAIAGRHAMRWPGPDTSPASTSRLFVAHHERGVRVRWRCADGVLAIDVEDDGPGLARTDNLWVPFFTTKPGGTGIGLVLSREIVENHGGTISLENRATGPGCIARVGLPIRSA